MSYKRRVRATELAEKRNERLRWYHLAALLVVGGIFFFFMERWREDTMPDRFARAKEFSTYYHDYFIPFPKVYRVFEDKVPLVVRARNLGDDFFSRDLPSMIAASELEVNRIIEDVEQLRAQDEFDEMKRAKVSFADTPELFELIKRGKQVSEQSLFNIADGEIQDFWDIAFRHHRRWNLARLSVEACLAELLPDVQMTIIYQDRLDNLFKRPYKEPVPSIPESLKRISRLDKNIAKKLSFLPNTMNNMKQKRRKRTTMLVAFLARELDIVHTLSVLPDMKLLRGFISYARPKYVKLFEKEKAIQIVNPNTAIEIAHFRNALFLRHLREKLPKDFDYFIVLGNRHGIWHLPKKYIRWTTPIDDPFALLNPHRGAIKLFAEEGSFATVRRREDYFDLIDRKATEEFRTALRKANNATKRDEVIRSIRNKYQAPDYIVDSVNKEVKRVYSVPVDWRTGTEAKKYKSVIVLDHDPVIARMYALSLFISDNKDIAAFEKQFPKTAFLILKNDDSLYIPKVSRPWALTLEQLKQLNKERSTADSTTSR